MGFAYLISLFLLAAVVALVYSAAQEAFAPWRRILEQALRRGAKLLGVLAVLAIAVYLLSKIS